MVSKWGRLDIGRKMGTAPPKLIWESLDEPWRGSICSTRADLAVAPTKDPNSDDCLQCGEEQQIGTLIMAGMGMMGTFGAFFLSLLYLCFDSNAATRLDG